jgi:hypothetical protein
VTEQKPADELWQRRLFPEFGGKQPACACLKDEAENMCTPVSWAIRSPACWQTDADLFCCDRPQLRDHDLVVYERRHLKFDETTEGVGGCCSDPLFSGGVGFGQKLLAIVCLM